MKNTSLRQSLILAAQSEQGTEKLVEIILKKDRKFVNRKITDLERELEDLNEAFEERLSNSEPIDESVVEVHFSKLSSLKDKITRYKEFTKEYL
jgi:hypothetical protein